MKLISSGAVDCAVAERSRDRLVVARESRTRRAEGLLPRLREVRDRLRRPRAGLATRRQLAEATLVDALDSLYVVGLREDYERAVNDVLRPTLVGEPPFGSQSPFSSITSES